MALTPQQKSFFESFGYLVIHDLLVRDIDWITSEFHAVFNGKGIKHDGSKRSIVVPFIDQSEQLCGLLDHPKVLELIGSLLDEDFNYVGGDGNLFTGNTGWHTDGEHQIGLYAKFHVYLDPLTRESGAIRVIPGSHLAGPWRDQLHKVLQAGDDLHLYVRDVPCIVVETQPGDVVVFDHNIYHASFDGGPARRHFAINVVSRAKTPAEIEELDCYLPRHCFRWGPRVHSDLMRQTASPARMRHLEQVIERETCLGKVSLGQ